MGGVVHRSALRCVIEHPSLGPLRVTSTHLNSRAHHSSARMAQAAAVAAFARKKLEGREAVMSGQGVFLCSRHSPPLGGVSNVGHATICPGRKQKRACLNPPPACLNPP